MLYRPQRQAQGAGILLLMCLLTVVAWPARPARTADEADLRQPVAAFLAGIEALNVEAAMAPWAEKSPYLAAQRQFLTTQFKSFDEERILDLKWVRTWQEPAAAWIRVTFRQEGRPAPNSGKSPAKTVERRTFHLVYEQDAWRIWRNAASERALAEAWMAASDAGTRQSLLKNDTDLLTPELFRQLRLYARELGAKPTPAAQIVRFTAILELAPELSPEPAEIARLLVSRGIVLNESGRPDEAAADFSQAITLFSGANEVESVAVARFNLGQSHIARRRFKDALAEFEASVADAGKVGAKNREAMARFWAGYARHSLLDHAGALTAYQASADQYRELKDGSGEARSLRRAGDVLKVLHRDAEAVVAWQRAADLYRDARMPHEEAEVLADVGLTQGVLGNYALAYLAQSRRVKVAVALKDIRVQADSISALALTLGILGQVKEAAAFLEVEVQLRQRLADTAGEAHALRQLADAFRDLYRYADAEQNYQRSLESSRKIQDRDQEARAVAGLARLLGLRGDFLRAAEMGEQAIRLFRELQLKSQEAEALRELGIQLRAQGRHAEALAQFQAGLKLDQEVGDLLGVARDLDETAQDHLLTGRFQEALDLYGQTLKVYQQAKVRMGEADIHNKLGAALQRLGRYTEAEAEYRKSYDISKEIGIEAGQQQAKTNLAGLFAITGRYTEAIRDYEIYLAEFRKVNDRSAEAITLTNLGKVYSGKGELVRALECHESALKIFRELNDTRSAAQELHNIANVNSSRSRYAEALAGFAEALKVFRTAGLRLDEATTLGAQATVYRQLGKPVEALALYEESLKIRTEIGDRPGRAKTVASIGTIQLDAHRYPEALKSFQEALETVRALGEKPTEITLLNNLGLVLRRMGRLEPARKYLEEALLVSRGLGGRSAETQILGNLALIDHLDGKPVEAERTYREALKLAEEHGLPDLAFRCRFGLGVVHRSRKEWRLAAQELSRCTGLIDQIRSDVKEQSLQTSFFERYVSPFHVQADTLLLAGEPAAAYLAGERARARALVDILRNGKVSLVRQMTPVEREAEEKLDGRLAALSSELREARFLPTDERLAREAQLTETRNALEQFHRQLYLTRPELQVQRGDFSPATLTQLNRQIFARTPDLCILSYLVGYSETLLFAMTRGPVASGPATLRVYRIPRAQQWLRERVETFWGECSRVDGQYRKPGNELFRDLIQPAAKDLAGKNHLVLVPDGPLHLLPFQALVDPAGKHLVERTALSYAPSVSALVAMVHLGDRRRAERKDAAAPRLVAFGRPKLDAGLSDLPATEKEVQAISRLVGNGMQVVTGPEASEERFKELAVRARSLHLATHGLVNEANPLYSSLALAHGEHEDGRLEARELLEMDLRAQLVVLSACETALGKTVAGEGVLGLTWSLFVAGVPSTVVSHWQVEDETTGSLMARFYRGMLPVPVKLASAQKPRFGKSLAGGKSSVPVKPVSPLAKAQSLRAAQLGVMRDGKHAHPYFWAPFIMVGDWRGGLD